MRAFISVLGSSMFRTVELHILLDICHSFSVPSDPGTHNKPKLVHTRSKAIYIFIWKDRANSVIDISVPVEASVLPSGEYVTHLTAP